MKTLIKLNTIYGRFVWINPAYISSIATNEGQTWVYIGNDTYPVIVRESPEAIIEKIESLGLA